MLHDTGARNGIGAGMVTSFGGYAMGSPDCWQDQHCNGCGCLHLAGMEMLACHAGADPQSPYTTSAPGAQEGCHEGPRDRVFRCPLGTTLGSRVGKGVLTPALTPLGQLVPVRSWRSGSGSERTPRHCSSTGSGITMRPSASWGKSLMKLFSLQREEDNCKATMQATAGQGG